ncbi:hypothetical protein OUZ56_033469 [Daphnia magna]|uniref:Nuclear factor related to kappa-B-binding protein second winged helix domain-containing protein n=1 Tax=Daphnia magna TaxID=35525 RepID=A0ABQ9ZXX1_9CRUS|nr:hypothetical protein OUZ56_033469 [Daphnia magna]
MISLLVQLMTMICLLVQVEVMLLKVENLISLLPLVPHSYTINQEKVRFQNATEPFTYIVNNKNYRVGPARKEPSQRVKAFKSFFTEPRPAAANMYSLMRDAIAQLPNSNGSLRKIAELLSESQYITRFKSIRKLLEVVACRYSPRKTNRVYPLTRIPIYFPTSNTGLASTIIEHWKNVLWHHRMIKKKHGIQKKRQD